MPIGRKKVSGIFSAARCLGWFGGYSRSYADFGFNSKSARARQKQASNSMKKLVRPKRIGTSSASVQALSARFLLSQQLQERGGSGVSAIGRPDGVLDGGDAFFLSQLSDQFLNEQEFVTTGERQHDGP
jgi:hypothetical protein